MPEGRNTLSLFGSVRGERVVVLTHGPCPDGAAAALVFGRACTLAGAAAVETHALQPGTPPAQLPRLENAALVAMLDVCYDHEWMRGLARHIGFDRFVLIDHHPHARDVVARLAAEQQHLLRAETFVFSDADAACVLAWRYAFPDAPVPEVLRYVSDRDTGKYALPHCREITASLIARGVFLPGNEEQLAALVFDPPRGWVETAVEHGRAVLAAQAEQCIQAVRDATVCDWVLPGCGSVRVAVIMVADWELYTHITELAAAARADLQCCAFPVPQGDRWTIRVRACHGFDTRVLTQSYPGGGGHAGAGSFTLPPGADYKSYMRAP